VSSVLFEPVNPCAPAITPNYTALLRDPEFKNVIKSLFFTLLEEDTEFKETVRGFIDCSITMSEHNILKRISTTEKILGLNDYPVFDEEDDHVPTIPEQIKGLASMIEQPLNKSTDRIKTDVDIIPQTVTEYRASELITHLKNDIAPRNGEVFLTSREIMIFLKDGIKEEYRIKKDVVNLRQTKKDVLKKAVEMFTTSVSLSKKSNGHKEVRIILRKQS
jgi:hypothetical protein